MHGFGIYNYYSSGLRTSYRICCLPGAHPIIGHSFTVVSRVACHTVYSSILHARNRLQCTYRMTIVDWMVFVHVPTGSNYCPISNGIIY